MKTAVTESILNNTILMLQEIKLLITTFTGENSVQNAILFRRNKSFTSLLGIFLCFDTRNPLYFPLMICLPMSAKSFDVI